MIFSLIIDLISYFRDERTAAHLGMTPEELHETTEMPMDQFNVGNKIKT